MLFQVGAVVLLEDLPRLSCGHDVVLGLASGVVHINQGHSPSRHLALIVTHRPLSATARADPDLATEDHQYDLRVPGFVGSGHGVELRDLVLFGVRQPHDSPLNLLWAEAHSRPEVFQISMSIRQDQAHISRAQ